MTDPLQTVEPSRWPSVLSLFTEHTGLTARATLKTQILNVEKNPDYPVKVYAPLGNPEDGVMVLWTTSPLTVELAFFCAKSDKSILVDSLLKTNVVDWSKVVIFCSMMPEIYPQIREVVQKLGYTPGQDQTYVAHISNEAARNFVIPNRPGVRVERIGPEYAEDINELWPHRYPGSILYFKSMLSKGLAIGLINEECNDLIGWIFTSIRGDLHALQIKDKYKRMGYGQMLVKLMSKSVADRGIEVFGCIITENTASKEMFAKCGFELLWVVNWIVTKP